MDMLASKCQFSTLLYQYFIAENQFIQSNELVDPQSQTKSIWSFRRDRINAVILLLTSYIIDYYESHSHISQVTNAYYIFRFSLAIGQISLPIYLPSIIAVPSSQNVGLRRFFSMSKCLSLICVLAMRIQLLEWSCMGCCKS